MHTQSLTGKTDLHGHNPINKDCLKETQTERRLSIKLTSSEEKIYRGVYQITRQKPKPYSWTLNARRKTSWCKDKSRREDTQGSNNVKDRSLDMFNMCRRSGWHNGAPDHSVNCQSNKKTNSKGISDMVVLIYAWRDHCHSTSWDIKVLTGHPLKLEPTVALERLAQVSSKDTQLNHDGKFGNRQACIYHSIGPEAGTPDDIVAFVSISR